MSFYIIWSPKGDYFKSILNSFHLEKCICNNACSSLLLVDIF